MEVGDCPLTVYTQHSALLSNLLRNMIAHSFCPSLSSIGGDQNLDSVTTLPSKSRCGFPCELCTSSPVDGALGSRQTAGFYFSPPIRISPVFRLHSDILRKFNPEIKGMSMGQGRNQSGFNMAVSGAKIE